MAILVFAAQDLPSVAICRARWGREREGRRSVRSMPAPGAAQITL